MSIIKEAHVARTAQFDSEKLMFTDSFMDDFGNMNALHEGTTTAAAGAAAAVPAIQLSPFEHHSKLFIKKHHPKKKH